MSWKSASPSTSQQILVEGYLSAMAPLPSIRIVHIGLLYDYYKGDQISIGDAEVRIYKLTASGKTDKIYLYKLEDEGTGSYTPLDQDLVQPGSTYKLSIQIPGKSTPITSQTTVPDTFAILSDTPATPEYPSDEPISLIASRSKYPGRKALYIFNALARDTSLSNYLPYYKQDIGRNPLYQLYERMNHPSGIIREENYNTTSSGDIELVVPWNTFVFYGRNRLVVNAIDDNIYDFLRSQQVQSGDSNLTPGEIPNLINHIDGAIGVFGSLASDTTATFVLKRSEE